MPRHYIMDLVFDREHVFQKTGGPRQRKAADYLDASEQRRGSYTPCAASDKEGRAYLWKWAERKAPVRSQNRPALKRDLPYENGQACPRGLGYGKVQIISDHY